MREINNIIITGHPIRIIPFDLGRTISETDIKQIRQHIYAHYSYKELTTREAAILKDKAFCVSINEHLNMYLYMNGICVAVIREPSISFESDLEYFSIEYGTNRKAFHKKLFEWSHPDSADIDSFIESLRIIVRKGSRKNERIRESGKNSFENRGMSYVMTLSMFDMNIPLTQWNGFENYPKWLQNNIYTMLDPSVLYLEDSSIFGTDEVRKNNNVKSILSNLQVPEKLHNYEHHKHLDTYMSWSAVLVLGDLLSNDFDEYVALEVQLQSDWYYVYCLEQSIKFKNVKNFKEKELIEFQRENYELDILKERLENFDDSSLPSRLLDVQLGLLKTSGLTDNINRVRRKTQFIIESERFEGELKQKKLSQSSEIFLFIIAFIQVAPTVAEFGNKISPHLGGLFDILLATIGIILMMIKNKKFMR